MRISGGAARGVVLQVPKGDSVRPATDGMRQAVFSSLASCVPGARFLDLFAGSGAYGLEAFSRGASGGVFVEKNRKAADCLGKNIETVCKSMGGARDALRVFHGDVFDWTLDAVDFVPDLVFIDPPYDQIEAVGLQLFDRLRALRTRGGDPLVIFEMPGEITLSPSGWSCLKRLGDGVRQPTVSFFRATP